MSQQETERCSSDGVLTEMEKQSEMGVSDDETSITSMESKVANSYKRIGNEFMKDEKEKKRKIVTAKKSAQFKRRIDPMEIGADSAHVKSENQIGKRIKTKHVENHTPRCVVISPNEIPNELQLEKLIGLDSAAFDLDHPVVWEQGEMLWGKVSGHPYWPCMISPCPFTQRSSRIRAIGKNSRTYHVQFFGDACERGWLNEASLIEYTGKEDFFELVRLDSIKPKGIKKGKSTYNPFKVKPARQDLWNLAVEEAENAYQLGVNDRKVQYTFDYVIPDRAGKNKIASLKSLATPSVQNKRKRKDSTSTPGSAVHKRHQSSVEMPTCASIASNPVQEQDDNGMKNASIILNTSTGSSKRAIKPTLKLIESKKQEENKSQRMLKKISLPDATSGHVTAGHSRLSPAQELKVGSKCKNMSLFTSKAERNISSPEDTDLWSLSVTKDSGLQVTPKKKWRKPTDKIMSHTVTSSDVENELDRSLTDSPTQGAEDTEPLKHENESSYEDIRKQNIEANKLALANLMADMNFNLPLPITPPKRQKRKYIRREATPEVTRRNPARHARKSFDTFEIPRKRSRSGSVSSSISSCSSMFSSQSSNSDKLVVRFGFFKRSDVISPTKTDNDSNSEYDEEDYPLPSVTRKPRLQKLELRAEDVTQADLDMVAKFVSDKKYDSIMGTSCHQCRQKTDDMKTVCRSGQCMGVRGQFCGPCLRNRYGECAMNALKDPDWACPPCRGVCNCSFCRKKKGKAPTGIFIHMAREKGFYDVCSYLQRNEK